MQVAFQKSWQIPELQEFSSEKLGVAVKQLAVITVFLEIDSCDIDTYRDHDKFITSIYFTYINK